MSTETNNLICEYCHKELGEPNFTTWSHAYKEFNVNRKRSVFCNEDCFKKYIKQYQVEEWNGRPIYMVEVNGQKKFLPGWSSLCYFNTIEECKKRFDKGEDKDS